MDDEIKRNALERESDREEAEKYRQAYHNLSPKDQAEEDRVKRSLRYSSMDAGVYDRGKKVYQAKNKEDGQSWIEQRKKDYSGPHGNEEQ